MQRADILCVAAKAATIFCIYRRSQVWRPVSAAIYLQRPIRTDAYMYRLLHARKLEGKKTTWWRRRKGKKGKEEEEMIIVPGGSSSQQHPVPITGAGSSVAPAAGLYREQHRTGRSSNAPGSSPPSSFPIFSSSSPVLSFPFPFLFSQSFCQDGTLGQPQMPFVPLFFYQKSNV